MKYWIPVWIELNGIVMKWEWIGPLDLIRLFVISITFGRCVFACVFLVHLIRFISLTNWCHITQTNSKWKIGHAKIRNHFHPILVFFFSFKRFQFLCRWQFVNRFSFTHFLHCNFSTSHRCKLSHFLYFEFVLIFILSLVAILIRALAHCHRFRAQFVCEMGMGMGDGGNDENRPFNLLCFTHFR